MKQVGSAAAIAGAFVLLLVLPLMGTLVHFDGVLPDYVSFPPLEAQPKPGFNPIIFSVLLVGCLGVVAFYLFPAWFGFRRPESAAIGHTAARVRYPWWFYAGLIVTVADAVILWGKFAEPVWVVNAGYCPIIWGVVFLLDGIVYRRSGGQSILAKRPWIFLGITFASSFSWCYFEYLSLLVGANWYNPVANRISVFWFNVYTAVGAATLMPFVLETYMVLASFPRLYARFSQGPVVRIPRVFKVVLLVSMIAVLFFMNFQPDVLFPFLWLAPVLVLAIVLDLCGIWTPFRCVGEKGDWTPLALVGLGTFFVGLIFEATNYFSATHDPFHTLVPGYWKYSVPYVHRFMVFEMPVEGLFGYFFYGVYNWVVWIAVASLFRWPFTFLYPIETEKA